ncbi:MAG: MFS transporter [Candidatus Gracilibacteria bacterium]|nr:MFS transporter [Candidatus Gracilibacteria bacterium]
MNKDKFIIILVGFLDVLGISMILPTLPDLAKYYGVTEHVISYGITAYAFFAFLATPFLGQLSDIFGRKKVLLLCVIGTFLSSLTIVFSETYLFFIIGRIINGITGGNISILQAIINDISKNKIEKMANMGVLGSIFGTAFIFGPLVGAILLHINVMAPYTFMAFFAFLESIVLIFLFKETNKFKVKKKVSFNPFKLILKYFGKKKLRLYLSSFFTMFLAFSIYQAILSLYLSKEYGVSGSFSGYVYATFGLIVVINQVFFLRRFWLKYFSLNTLLYIINFGAFGVYLLLTFLSFGHYLFVFLGVFLLLVPFQSLLNPVYQIEIMEHASETEKGEISGVVASIHSISMFIGPLIGGFLLEKNINVFIASALLIFISIIFVFKINKYEN